VKINFGGWQFSYPMELASFKGYPHPALYCLSVLDSAWEPYPYRPVYFGEAADVETRAIGITHHAIERWLSLGGRALDLHVSVSYVPHLIDYSRQLAESMLIAKYRTLLNQGFSVPKNELGRVASIMTGQRN
jgi:hypothetical protein